MLPLREDSLTLEEVARHWSHELGGPLTQQVVHAKLFAAFWNEELTVFVDHEENVLAPRALLATIRRVDDHPGFVLVETAEEVPPSEVERPNGGVEFVTTHYVVLPRDPATWTEETVKAACDDLSGFAPDRFAPIFAPGLAAMGVTKAAFADYCNRNRFKLPKFWFAGNQRSAERVALVRQARDWLRAEVGRNGITTKRETMLRAQAAIPGLSDKAFQEAWASSAVPARYKRPGAKPRRQGGF